MFQIEARFMQDSDCIPVLSRHLLHGAALVAGVRLELWESELDVWQAFCA